MREHRSGLEGSRGVARFTIASIVAAAVVVVHTSAVSASGWGIASSPNQGGNNFLNGVSCTSLTSCVAVGHYYDNGSSVDQTLVESWNGSTWSVIASLNPGDRSNEFNSVSCTSSASCVAVGEYEGGHGVLTLVESWNGSAWSIISSPNPASSEESDLFGVSCTSATSCVAVGEYYDGSADQTLGETWNGSTWSLTSSLNQGTGFNVLSGVSCTSATSCAAVGDSVNASSVEQTLAESWNGTSWSIASSPDKGTGNNALNGVSCTITTSCEAVGFHDTAAGVKQTLVESSNGTSWTVIASPNHGTGNNVLSATDCTSSSSCTSVGESSTPVGVEQTLVESWNGTSWSSIASPDMGTGNNVLNAVSCTSSTSCVAVGDDAADVEQTLVESWNGTSWSVAVSPDLGGSDNGLSAVKCTSSTNCMAVGAYSNGAVQQTLVEGWNGSIWAVIASPNQGTSSNSLLGVACTSSTSCVAVGTYAKAGVEQTLIETWNGSTWTITPSPNSGTGINILNGVACTSSTSCEAVGYAYNGSSIAQTLIESWSGSAWTISSGSNRPSSTNDLTAVSCTSPTSCTAVGVWATASIAQTLIESWNGSAWSLASSPNAGSIAAELTGVKCTSSTSCTAVGDYFNASNVDQTLVESWSGGTWSTVASPNQGAGNNSLLGVACPSSTSCVAVGFFRNASSVPQTLVESWNGTTWAIVASPNQGTDSNLLIGVACSSSTSCTGVGAYTSAGTSQTLVETGPASSVSSSITVTAPTTGASWARGSSHAIKWSSTGSPGADVKIQLLKSGVVVKTITTSVLTSAGTFTWKVPSTLSPATSYQIKIVSTTNAKVFGISGKFSIT